MSSTLAKRLIAALPPPADASAAAARQSFIDAGLPTNKVEAWRYSSLRGMQALDPAAGYADLVAHPELAGVNGTLATLIAGEFVLSSTAPAAIAMTVGAGSRRDQSSATPAQELRDARSLLQVGQQAGRAFEWLNAAGSGAGLSIDVQGHVAGIWRLALQHDALGLSQSRVHIVVRQNASITLLEHWFGGDEAIGLSNAVLDIDLEAGATVTLIRLQETGAKAQSVQRSAIRCDGDATVTLVNLELGGLWSRHDLQLNLEAAGANAHIHGLVALQGRQHHDTQLALTHAAGAAHSKTLWKAIADARARSVFDGLITVAPGADQTEAHLKTANLLLSAHAEIDTKPELVIEADEVVCSHGATVGQLDDRALYYLRSRGIPMAQARQMLTLAFGGEVLAGVADAALREALAARVAGHLPQGLGD